MNRHQTHDHAMVGSRLAIGLLATIAILVVEASVGFAANSLALVADAGHVLTDALALGLAWLAVRRAARPPDDRYTFGYGRTTILAALTNGVVLIVIALVIAFEAFNRIQHTPAVQGLPVILAAVFGAAVNLFVASSLSHQRHDDLNIRAAFLHVVGDIAASVGVVIAGIIIVFTHAYVVDPILSWAIGALIAFGALRIVGQTAGILMEATPPGVDIAAMASAMREIPGVEEVHDLHVWSLSDGFRLLSVHVRTPDQSLSSAMDLLADLRILLSQRFGVRHSTIEIECQDCTVPTSRPITMHISRPGD